jgi:hypothetical protein
MYVLIFWTTKYERKACLNWMRSLQVLPRHQLIFPSKTWFFEIYLNFQQRKSLKNKYRLHSESKSYQINFIKSSSSRSFQQHQRHIPIPLKFSATILFYFIFSEKIIQYSRAFAVEVQTSWNQAQALLLVKSFPKTPRTRSEASWSYGSHNYKTKQTTFLHSFIHS